MCLVGFASLQSPWAHTLRHPCLFMNALLALRPAKPLGVHFRHPCLACPSRCTNSHHSYSLLKRTSVPRLTPTSLPPLSKVRCCRPKKFGRLPEGLPHQTSPSPQPLQKDNNPSLHTMSLPLYERSVGFASCKTFGRSFQASLPCLPLPLRQPSPFLQPS